MLNFNVFKNLSKLEILATLLSAIGHDLDHPGMNNAYQMNALTTLAITYNDSSPLENHHSGPYLITSHVICNLETARVQYLGKINNHTIQRIAKNRYKLHFIHRYG